MLELSGQTQIQLWQMLNNILKWVFHWESCRVNYVILD